MKHLTGTADAEPALPAQADDRRPQGRHDAAEADSLLFNSLLIPSWTAGELPPAESSRPVSRAPAWPAGAEAAQSLSRLEQQLGERLADGPHAISCNLLLPRLGEIRLDARLERNDWHIDLAFLHAPALAHARRQHSHLAQRLRERLGRHVVLGLHLRGEDPLDDSLPAALTTP